MSNTITPFNKNCITKVTWQKKAFQLDETLEADKPRWLNWTGTFGFKPSAVGASTLEETIKAAHRLKFGRLPLESLTPCEDGSFLMTYQYGTLRVIFQQEAYVPKRKSNEEYEEEMACMWHDWE
jgi:hypothetical protein